MSEIGSDRPKSVRGRLTRPVLVIAVDGDHAFVAYTAWQDGKAARVRDALRARHAGTGLRFHCAPSHPERWRNREAQLFADAERAKRESAA
jgi:hypothetical protein